jgi:serine protease Do
MKRTTTLILLLFFTAFAGGIIGSIFTFRFLDFSITPYQSIDARQQSVLTNFTKDSSLQLPKEMNFLSASEKVTAGVVHIRATYGPGSFSLNPLERFYDNPTRSSGSGVIISDDGFIVTNNHVIEDATNIEVVMNNNQRFYAKIIGTDPSTDLALLKIKARDLPFVHYGNSDSIKPGEWVLAIGNPFELNSTVTAGIVSAKARNLRILRDRNNLQVESFIQTDAAVNPGNSGGALVNLQGELIGINTAIATATGSYSGYSFAIPVSLVRKVMDDLLEFGEVQRGLLGVNIVDVDANLAENFNLPVNQGVFVSYVNPSSAAEAYGIQKGDVILAIDGFSVNSVSELQERVARHRPGVEVAVTFLRADQKATKKIRLRDREGKENVSEREVKYELDGMVVQDVSYKELARLKLEGGVLVKKVHEGKWKKAGIKNELIITYIDKVPVDNVEDLNRILEYKRGGVLIEGIDSEGVKHVYGLDW